jgi:hypothetical protein
LLTFVSVLTAWICAAVFGELTGVAFGDELIFTTAEVYAALALAALLNLAPHFATVSYGLFISTVTRRPAAAIGLAAGIWLLLDYVKHPIGISPFLFTTYLDQAWIVFQDRCNALDTPFFPEAVYGLLICLAWFLVFALASIFVFGRRSFGP